VFGAIAFSIVSFTCVAPFLGGFSAYVSSGGYTTAELALAALTFAGAFAFPFFFLSLFPTLLRKLPRSGGWLDSVKVVMGFLELAAVLKFFRTAEIRLADQPEYFTYDVVLAGWVAIAGATGLYLLNLFRLPHDEERSNVGVVRMLIALAFLGLGVYLAPALVKSADGQRPRPAGVVYAWVEAFLLPDVEPWGTDLKAAVDRIVREKRDGKAPEKGLIFVDFTGETCTNCKYNEMEVFPRSEVQALLNRYELVQLYTDDVPAEAYADPPDRSARRAEARVNLKFQKDVLKDERLPLYAILEPLTTGKVRVVAVYEEGKINDVGAFVGFLKKGQK
jgi:thiol:disulfide interchange protein DsbD